MSITFVRRRMSILVLNPNSSRTMTDGMARAIKNSPLGDAVDIHTYTAPSNSPESINDDRDLERSREVVMASMGLSENNNPINVHDDYDGVLVACYSEHDLVRELELKFGSKLVVTGIFEASVLTALSLVQRIGDSETHPQGHWGIVTTGSFWEKHLTDALTKYLGTRPKNFVGVYSTQLNAGDFHSGQVGPEEIRARLKSAAKRLMASSNVQCVVLGCAGMAGLEKIIRSAATEVHGENYGREIYVIDPVQAGVMQLEQFIKSKRAFRKD